MMITNHSLDSLVSAVDLDSEEANNNLGL
jgi:hypothetical protein